MVTRGTSSPAQDPQGRATAGKNVVERVKANPLVAGVLLVGALAGAVTGTWALWERLNPPPPVVASVDVQVETVPAVFRAGMQDWEPFFYYLPTAPSALTEPPDDCRDRRDWAWALDGADADETWVQVTVENTRQRGQVRIQDLRVEVEDEQPTPAGVVAACPVGGASADPVGLLVDLADLSLSYLESAGQEPVPVPQFELDPGEQDAFAIRATAAPGELVRWRIVGEVSSAGEVTPLTLDDGGEPFRTAGTVDAAGEGVLPMLVWDGGAWVPLQ